jgi:hypothetical protein
VTKQRPLSLAERARTTGQIELVVRRGDVEVLRIAVKNTIVYGGRTALLLLLQQALGGPAAMGGTPGHLVPGTNGTPPTVGDLALGAPLGGSDQIALTARCRSRLGSISILSRSQ